MGDNRKSAVVWIALTATAVQRFAGSYGPSPSLPTSQACYVVLLTAAFGCVVVTRVTTGARQSAR